MTGRHDRAIVIGASMAGVLAARALADYYDRVLLVERDELPPTASARRGVPQGPHSHLLLARGSDLIEQFFPGIVRELTDAGAIPARPQQLRFCMRGGFLETSALDRTALLGSRPLLEYHLRRRLLAQPNVTIERADVAGLVANDNGRVAGVRAIRRRDGSAVEVLGADLVVDASGRGSRTPSWLESLGYPKPDELQVRVGIGYTTRLYRRRPDHLDGDALVVSTTVPPHWRFGVLIAQEHDRWTVSVGGYLGDHAPTSEADFLAFVEALSAREIYDVVKAAEPLSDPRPYKFPSSLRRRYEKLRAFPAGYLVVGDAICSVNPVYGQGMTLAALQAEALGRCLAKGTERLAPRFFASASRAIDVAWSMALGDDLRHPAVDGPRRPAGRLLDWYLDKLLLAARTDARLASTFLDVAGMDAPPSTLVRPLTVARVVAGAHRRGRAARRNLQTRAAEVHDGLS